MTPCPRLSGITRTNRHHTDATGASTSWFARLRSGCPRDEGEGTFDICPLRCWCQRLSRLEQVFCDYSENLRVKCPDSKGLQTVF